MFFLRAVTIKTEQTFPPTADVLFKALPNKPERKQKLFFMVCSLKTYVSHLIIMKGVFLLS